MARVGVFVCHCGSNIAATVDVAKVAEEAAKLDHVVYATDYLYMCSTPGQDLIQEKIQEHSLDRVVVAACSPRMHERTFRKATAHGGLNPYLMEQANIREHDSWVHVEIPVATEKAIDIVRMAVAKAVGLAPLESSEVGVTKRCLVIGGGVAGVQAALDVAEAGYEVVIVEREPSLGGRMAQLDKTFPTLDCSACILTPKLVDAAQHPNIKLYTYSEVVDVKGFVGNFEVTIKRKARHVDEGLCTGCGICWNECPLRPRQRKDGTVRGGFASEFEAGMGNRAAIYVPFAQAVPLVPVIDTEHCTWFVKGGKCGLCAEKCPRGAVNYEQSDELVTEPFGAVVVATGFDLFDATVQGEYGYGRFPDVVTGLELERLMNASGPTHGHVLRPSDGQPPKTVVLVSCVGSRDKHVGRPYCSTICCMYLAKHAIMLKEHDPEVNVYNFYMDIRAGGKDYDEFTRRAIEQYDAHYIRGRVSEIYERDGKLIVEGADTLMGRPVEIAADMVVLATGVTAPKGARELFQTLNISYNQYGFINEAHPKLQPVETNTDGIFLTGCITGPKDIPATVAQASGAAAKALGILTKDSLVANPMVAEVDERECVACYLCVEVCPYGAIEKAATRRGKPVARVNPSVCKGCGLCVNVCRGSAVNLKGFTEQQLVDQVVALFAEPMEVEEVLEEEGVS
jgi:heterodisulfide reductase subunit A